VANLISDVFGGGGIASFLGKVLDDIHTPPELKAKIEEQAAQNELALQQLEAETQIRLNTLAVQEVQAESSSRDGFVRRARPAFLWMMTLALGFNLFLPLASQLFGGHLQPLQIPGALYGLFGTAFTGYVAARTYEKTQGKD
jgi:hypothetical protein